MKLTTLKMAVLGALMLPTMSVIAEEAATAAVEAPKSDFSFSANVGIYSDYIFRGYTQTQNNPALQGGMDVEHSSGFYAGTWASNVEWATQPAQGMNENSLEVDVYAGYATELAGIGLDVGVLQYLYPGDLKDNNAETNATELYVAISKSFGPVGVALKNSTIVSDDAWGYFDMQGENYTELNVDFPVGPLALSVHVGHQTFGSGSGGDLDYTDWKLNAEYALNDTFAIGAFYTDTNQDKTSWDYFDGVEVGDSVGGGYLSASF